MSIPSEFRDDWNYFNSRAKVEGMTPVELIRDLIEEYLQEYEDEREQAEEEMDELAPLRDKVPKKVKKKFPLIRGITFISPSPFIIKFANVISTSFITML